MKTRSLVSLAAAVCAAGSLWADSGTWTATTGGNWNDVANWNGGIIASNAGSTAVFNSGTGTINNDMTDPALALLGLQFAGGSYALAGNTLTLDSAGFITVAGGTNTVSLPLVLGGNATFSAASAQTLKVDGAISGNGGLAVYGGRVVLGNAANSYTGATVLVTGILEVASVTALGGSSTDPANLVLGEGTFRYTGASATMNRGYTLLPGVSTNRAAVIDVTNATTTLTIAGKVAAPGGAFIKTGEGTLAFTYPGYQELSKNRLPNKENGVITYDANGVAATNEYATFTLERGRMILGAPGQTNLINSSSGWIGCKTLASPRLDIIGGVTRFVNGYLTIGRGTGTTASPQSPSMYISNGSYVTVEGSGLVLDNSNGQANHRCRPILSLDNSTLRVAGDIFFSEDGNATTTVNVANNSLLISDSTAINRWGMSLSPADGAKTDVTFSNNSTGLVYYVSVRRGSTLNVVSNSVFTMDGTTTNITLFGYNLGTVRFNNGLLSQRTTAITSDWFNRLTNVWVGANDMTINVASHAWLDPVLRADPASPGGKVIKKGNGTLSMRPTGLNVQVDAGKISFASEYPWTTNGNTGTLTLSSGSSIELAGAGGAGSMNLGLAGAPLTFSTHNLCLNPDLWRYNERAMKRADGYLQLAANSANIRGSAFLQRRFAVSNAWTASFSYIAWTTSGTPADGFSFILHNDPRGTMAIGGSGAWLGYADSTTNRITNSVAVGINVYGTQSIKLGRQGTFVDARNLSASLPNLALTPVKTRFTVSYDGVGVLTAVVMRDGFTPYRYTWPVNLVAELGSGEAYVGFGAGTGNAFAQHTVCDFLFDNGSTPLVPYCRYGGRLALSSGETLNASLTPSRFQRGFVSGQLAYADSAVLNVSTPVAVPPASLANQALWALSGKAHWLTDGRLAVSSNAVNSSGYANTTNRYPVTGSWTARFGFDMGQATVPPADYITFTVQNNSTNNTLANPTPGLSVMWRYYEGGTNYTSLRIYTNSVQVYATNNIAPINLMTGQHANMTVAYDAPTKALTVTTIQGTGTNITLFANVDVLTALANQTEAYLGFSAFTGGLYAENIISDFSFTSPSSGTAGGYLAFDKISGTGTLVKRGNAAFALQGDLDLPTSNAVLRLEQGALLLRKNNHEAIDTAGARSEWIFSPTGMWGDDGTLQVTANVLNSVGTGTSTRRIRVSDAWTATFSFLFGARSTPPADAFSFFMHNDPRGPTAVGGNAGNAGYSGITRSIGLRWYFYPLDLNGFANTTSVGHNGVWSDGAARQSHAPLSLTNGVTDFVVKYNPTAATLTSVMSQGALVITNTFTGVSIATDIGDNFAFVGFGGGCGGSCGEMRIKNFRLVSDLPSDALPNQQVLGSLILPGLATNTATLDTSVPNSSFKFGTATVGDGAVFGVDTAQQNGTLTLGSVTQSGAATYSVAAGCTLALANVTGGATFTKTGAGTLALAGTAATYTGNTVLGAGTLALSAACLPSTTDLYVTSGAMLNIAFAGKQYVHSLYVNGVQQHGGQYTVLNASWLIAGPGVLVVTYPPVGTLISVR